MTPSSTSAVALGLPLAVALSMTVGTIVIHAFALVAIVHFMRRQHRLRRAGVRFWTDVAIIAAVTLAAGAAHMIEIVLWALVFRLYGESIAPSTAIYNSAMLYTTMGWADVPLSPSWEMLGPFEAADGLLMFSITTAIVIAVIQGMVRTKFHDLPEL